MKRSTTFLWMVFFIFLSSGYIFAENPFNADIVVAADGSGDFTLIQPALDAVPLNSERRTVIYIKRGVYDTEKLIVEADKINVTLIGESREETVISYHIYDCSAGKCPEEDAAKWTGDNIRTSATLTIQGDGFRAENLTIQNTAGPVGQAQAITVRSDKVVFINCDLKGYQDTMYFWNDGNRAYFEGCLVVGRTDYIYGGGIVFFQDCEIRSYGGAYITAPSTQQDQMYGFVFNQCDITYSLNSPRPSDDGELIRFGRPWHNYPKVSWLRCEITEKLNPLGWGDTWNMEYAPTSPDLHLYEYNNSGPGADMSGRADWVGIRAMTDEEAGNYTVQKVLAGDDGWDPTAEEPLIVTYNWTGGSTTGGWLVPENWDPAGIPANGEAAIVSHDTIIADGGIFEADLNLKDTAVMVITGNSTARYISADGATFFANAEASLDGSISTKDTCRFVIANAGIITLNASLTGVHDITKSGEGNLTLAADNMNYSGDLLIYEGNLEASASNSLGTGAVYLMTGASLTINVDDAFQPDSKLDVSDGGLLVLNGNIVTSQFLINGVIQDLGVYNSTTNPGLISGTGSITVGRPEIFTFLGGNWDDPSNFSPSLIPQAGETVIVETEMETTSTVFEADMILRGNGSLRLRGDQSRHHTSSGEIHMEEGTSFKYNTGGSGMYIDAPVIIEGNVFMIMESDNPGGSALTLDGSLSGSGSIIALNNGKGTLNTGTLILMGDNSEFSGVWDLTEYSNKYPETNGFISAIDARSENAFGTGTIVAGHDNRVVINHSRAAGDVLDVSLNESAKAVLGVTIPLLELILNGTSYTEGIFSQDTHPEYFEGSGSINVGATGFENTDIGDLIYIYNDRIRISGDESRISVYDILGHKIFDAEDRREISIAGFSDGIYILRYTIDGKNGVMKFKK